MSISRHLTQTHFSPCFRRLCASWSRGPIEDFSAARSGGVLAGATAIEVSIFAGEARLPLRERRPSQVRGIAFEPALADAELFTELDARAIAPTEPESVAGKGFPHALDVASDWSGACWADSTSPRLSAR